jgi:hypothetical protein
MVLSLSVLSFQISELLHNEDKLISYNVNSGPRVDLMLYGTPAWTINAMIPLYY